MRIEWVNHASFLVDHGGVRLLCDPWIEGTAFHDGWALLTPTRFGYDEFRTVTHIWFSHEHPDHFSPPNLKRIPADARSRITVLFQETHDRKVVEFCRSIGFGSVVELAPGRPERLADDFEVLCRKVANETDSWLRIRADGRTLLNLNDCVFRSPAELDRVAREVGGVDVLFTQFSYANWVGNEEDTEYRQGQARRKLEEMASHLSALRPTWVVPFASFVWFCNRDNFFMNRDANRIGPVHEWLRGRGAAVPLVFYPGDSWDVGTTHDSGAALEKYSADYARIESQGPSVVYAPVSLEELQASAESFRTRSLERNDRRKLLSYPPFTFHLTDLSAAFEFSFRDGLDRTSVGPDSCDVSLASRAMKYCFDFAWGFDTLIVSGAFRKPTGGRFPRMEEYQWIATLNNRGKRMPGLLARAFNKLSGRV